MTNLNANNDVVTSAIKELKELNVKTQVNIPIIDFADKEKTIDIESEDIKDDKTN